MKTVKFTPLAEYDLETIWQYISEANHQAADKLVHALLQKCGLLARNSRLGRTRDDLMVSLRSFPHKNYVIFYFPMESGIEIYRILHSARDIAEVFAEYISDLPNTEEN